MCLVIGDGGVEGGGGNDLIHMLQESEWLELVRAWGRAYAGGLKG